MAFSPNAETVYADGPFGSPLQPSKPDIRSLLAQYEAAIDAYSSGAGSIAKSTRALLFVDLAHTADVTAWVYADSTVAYNGIYRKSGSSGAGSWSLILPLPFSFIIASDAGAGTPNAIQATTSIPVSSSALVWTSIFEANTASPVTISFNGGSALTIKTNTGNNIAAGGLAAGMIVMGIVSGSTFRLVSDQVSAAIVAAAEDAADRAEAAAAEAANKVSRAGDTMTGNLGIEKIGPTLTLNDTGAGQARIRGQRNAVTRWTLDLGDGDTESGSNTGSNYELRRYSDAGALLGTSVSVDRATGVATFEKIPAGGGVLLGEFDTETAFLAANIPAAVKTVTVCGRAARGDNGKHDKVRIAGPGTEPWQVQSADGAWWDIADQNEYAAEIFGLGAGGADTASWETAADFITTRGGILRVPAGEFTLTNDWSVTSLDGWRIIGAGKDVTIFKRADTGTVAFWNIVNSSDYVIADLTLNCQRSNVAVGTGSHALRMDRGENITVHRVKVTDYTDTGIIYFDTADPANGLHDNVSVIECECDGLSNANNGILLNNTRRGLMAHNKVINLGRQGAPQFAIQFKARNVDGKSFGNWIENCRGGVAIGSTDVAAPSNVNCHSSFEIVKGATRALRATYSSFCTMHAEVIDMDEASDAGNPTEDTDEHAVFLNQVDNCVVRIGHLRGYEDTKYVVALPTAAGCSVLIDTWRNVPQTSKFLDLGVGASGNVVEVKNYVGTPFDFPMDLVQNASGSANTFRISSDVMSQRTTIASDAITILNPAVARYRLDTEGAAATDNLATINGGTDGQVVAFTTTSDARDVVLKHNTGNIFLKGAVDRTLGTINDIVVLMFSSFAGKWLEV
ncbi:hypothetical protein GOC61_25475 [Sinorhizobium medicae]|nr:hypothetical protein [Sinorhizobium medicae]MDX1059382.1 hypothetical protein [Sinorhizobium medicae]